MTLSAAAGNGLNGVNPFSLAPYADDLEDDLKDINGRNRDYLLEAWYKRTFMFSDDMKLAVTGGIIDSTGYIDDNAFANDETGQFMNDIFSTALWPIFLLMISEVPLSLKSWIFPSGRWS